MKGLSTNLILLASLFVSSFQLQAKVTYKDVLISNNTIWTLTTSGSIELFDAVTVNRLNKEISADNDISLITKDKIGNIVVANERKQIKKYDERKNTWKIIGQYYAKPLGLLIDSKGSCFSITEKGIQDLTTTKLYFNNKSLNTQISYKTGWGVPYCYYIDKNDIIWIGFGYGEWGGNLFAFNTIEKKFLDLSLGNFEIALSPIKSFFEDSSAVYISAGLQHMMTSGIIVKVKDLKASILFNSESHWSDSPGKDRTWVEGEYFGPATYNQSNNSIYFFSQHGFFRGEETRDLSKIENWEKLANPKLTWTYGQPDAVGSPMNVLKLFVIDRARFVFLSQNDGIGFFDGQKVVKLSEE